MPVRIRIVGKSDAVLVLQADEPRHRIRAGAVHANHAVVIDRHEGKGRIDHGIDDCDVQPVDRR